MPDEIQTPEQGTETTEPVTQPINTEEPVAPETTAVEEPAAPSTEQPAPEQTPTEPQPQTDPYKEKFVASQREAILLAEREKVAKAQLEQLTKTDTPTDEAMKALYPEWDQLDAYNKRVLIRQETIAMQQAGILARQQEEDARKKLEDELDGVIESTPKLHGKEAEFRRFARNPKNRGIAADVLAKAFLFDADEAPTPVPKAEGLPTGSGGPREPLKPAKISIKDAAILQKTNFKEYRKQLLAGNIEEEI